MKIFLSVFLLLPLLNVSCASDDKKPSQEQTPPTPNDTQNGDSTVDDFDEVATGTSNNNNNNTSSKGCHKLTFDYDANGERIRAGDRIKNQYESWGVTMDFNVRDNKDNWGITFDAGKPTGGDDDLGVDVGRDSSEEMFDRILILAENIKDSNNNGKVDEPDDNLTGGKMYFFFNKPAIVKEFVLIDNQKDDSRMVMHNTDEGKIEDYLPMMGDGEYQTVQGPEKKGDKFVINLSGTGAIDNLVFCFPE